MLTGVELIAEERKRHEKIGWTTEHDDEHSAGALAVAGASYALDVASRLAVANGSEYWADEYATHSQSIWPFDAEWFKPTPKDDIRELVKAGALIAAEIDRIQRQALLSAEGKEK